MLKKLIIGTNTKMYKTNSETIQFLKELSELTRDISRDDIELFVIPSFTTLEGAKKAVSPDLIKIGAQNMHWEDNGQFTGEVSPRMLKEIGVDIVEIGHSERRHVFGETDFEENKKVLTSLKYGFRTLLCIGETMEEKEFGISDEVLSTQLKIGLHGVKADDIKNLWIAYEPVWAIGVNGIPASAEYAEEKHYVIKSVLNKIFGEEGKNIPVLYGGSVNPGNSDDLIKMPSIDGLFVGRSAWDAEKFNVLIRQILSIIV